MKRKSFFLVCLAGAVLAAVSCEKTYPVDPVPVDVPTEREPDGEEIVIYAEHGHGGTKAVTPVTSIPSTLYWGVTSGTTTETVVYATASGTVSSGKLSTGKYRANGSGTPYNYYLANRTFTAGGTMTVPANTDVVVGRTAQSTSASPTVNLIHVFARSGSLSMPSTGGFTYSNLTWKIRGKSSINGTAGTFNMKTLTWTASSAKLTSDTVFTSSSDLYLIPGEYTVTVTGTATKGTQSQTFTVTSDITFQRGKINNITGNLDYLGVDWDDDWDDDGEIGL